MSEDQSKGLPFLKSPPENINDINNNVSFNKRKSRKKSKNKKLIHNDDNIDKNENTVNNKRKREDDDNTNINLTSIKSKKRKLNENYQENINENKYKDIHKIESEKMVESENYNHAAVEVYKDEQQPKSLIECMFHFISVQGYKKLLYPCLLSTCFS